MISTNKTAKMHKVSISASRTGISQDQEKSVREIGIDEATIDPNLLLPLSAVNHLFTHFAASTIFTNALIFSSSAMAFIRS
jgi:hypothetical protein